MSYHTSCGNYVDYMVDGTVRVPPHEHVRCLHIYCIDQCPLCDDGEREARRCSCY